MNEKIKVDPVVLKDLYGESVDLAIQLQDFIFKVKETLNGSENCLYDAAVTFEPILCEILFHDWMFTVAYMNDMASYSDNEKERKILKTYPFNATSDYDECPEHCRKLRDIIAQFYKDMKEEYKP